MEITEKQIENWTDIVKERIENKENKVDAITGIIQDLLNELNLPGLKKEVNPKSENGKLTWVIRIDDIEKTLTSDKLNAEIKGKKKGTEPSGAPIYENKELNQRQSIIHYILTEFNWN